MSDDPERAEFNERRKLLADYFKHIATLATGSIIIVSALAERYRDVPNARTVVGASLAAFVLSMVGAVHAHFIVILDPPGPHPRRMLRLAVFVSSLGLVAGLTILAIFALVSSIE